MMILYIVYINYFSPFICLIFHSNMLLGIILMNNWHLHIVYSYYYDSILCIFMYLSCKYLSKKIVRKTTFHVSLERSLYTGFTIKYLQLVCGPCSSWPVLSSLFWKGGNWKLGDDGVGRVCNTVSGRKAPSWWGGRGWSKHSLHNFTFNA